MTSILLERKHHNTALKRKDESARISMWREGDYLPVPTRYIRTYCFFQMFWNNFKFTAKNFTSKNFVLKLILCFK